MIHTPHTGRSVAWNGCAAGCGRRVCHPPEYEKEVHEAVPGSRYVKLSSAGHFPPTEIPDQVNALIEEFVATL